MPTIAIAIFIAVFAIATFRNIHLGVLMIPAADWLAQHGDVDYPQGVPTEHPDPWGEAIRFYHYAARAEAYKALEFPAEKAAELAVAVARRQRSDGSFVNADSPLMKEDDPVLCTALATVALANCLPA